MSGWTDERVERLKQLWKEGLSASQIAKELRGVTRNAVIGKLSRLGMTANGPHATRRAASAPARVPRAPTVARNAKAANGANMKGAAKGKPALVFANDSSTMNPEPRAPFSGVKGDAFAPLAGSQPKAWTERRFGECAWPVGEGEGADQHSCCEPVMPERSWCRRHCVIGTQRPASGQPRTGNELARSLRRYVAA